MVISNFCAKNLVFWRFLGIYPWDRFLSAEIQGVQL